MQNRFNGTLDDFFAPEHDGDGPPEKLGVAVSGGGDSMALLHLAAEYCKKRHIGLHAFTVDHGLRATSAGEAQQAGAWCRSNAIEHTILLWQGDKPQTGLQDAARNARRRLLTDACKKNGIAFLLLGHQADDQAETVLMRLARGTGLRGLLGMRFTTETSGVTLLRPLLEQRRADLRLYCQTHSLPVSDDPGNDDAAFERVRVRKLLASWPELANGVAQTLARLADTDETLDLLAAEWLEEHAEPISNDTLWLPDDFLHALYPPVQLRILGGAVLEVSPEASDISEIPLDGLERLHDAVTGKGFSGQTLAGVQIKPHKADGTGGLLFQPAPARRS